jgi:hypothetical protein
MKLQIRGHNVKKFDAEFVRLYTTFVLGKFISPEKLKDVHVTILIIDPKSMKGENRDDLEKFLAWMNRREDGHFFITLNTRTIKRRLKDPLLRVKDALISIGHELVHVKQYVNGESRDYANGDVWWKGKRYPKECRDDISLYYFSEWEIEAYGLELGLFEVFRKEVVDFLTLKK